MVRTNKVTNNELKAKTEGEEREGENYKMGREGTPEWGEEK